MKDKLEHSMSQITAPLINFSADMMVSLVVSAVIVLACVLIYLWIHGMLGMLFRRGRLSEITHLMLKRLTRWALVLVAVMILLQQYGMMQNAWTTLTAVLAMVAIGFVAVWSVLSNTLCSIILMIVRPFNVGDTVEMPGSNLGGKVIDFNMIYTTLRDAEDCLLQVPNNLFFQQPIRRTKGKHTVTLDQQADRDKPME